jgi:protein-S-isoprenylcysteine O-methyltransferase Ste14
MEAPHISRPSAVPWPPVLIAAALALAMVLGRISPLAWPGLDDLPARIVGYGLGGAGIVLVAWGAYTLHAARTTMLPHKGASRLISSGPFRYRRNPIYMGEVLIFLGLAELTHNIWFAIVAPLFAIAILRLAILPEERHLEERFGQDYLDYKERTRRWF